MSTLNGLSTNDFARAIKTLGRSSEAAAKVAAARVDQLPDHSRRLGSEISHDGFVSQGEMSEYVRLSAGIGQGMSAQEKRLGQAARVLHAAMFEAEPVRLSLLGTPPPVQWRKEVPIATLSGTVQVKNGTRVVLETDLKKLAQRIAGPGQKTIGPDDFAKALPLLTPNEHYLAMELLNALYFSAPLATWETTGATPGGRAAKLTTVATGEGDLPTGGYHPMGEVTYAIHAQHALELSLKSREVVVDLHNGATYTPDSSGKVSIPLSGQNELAIVTRGASGKVQERLTVGEAMTLEAGRV